MSTQTITRNIADLSMNHFLMLAFKLCEEQGYITPDGIVTALGEDYLAVLVQEEADQMAAIDTSYAASLERAKGECDWTEFPDF